MLSARSHVIKKSGGKLRQRGLIGHHRFPPETLYRGFVVRNSDLPTFAKAEKPQIHGFI